MTITGYDPFAPEVIADPYPWYAWLREQAPVHHNAERGIWVLSRHADVYAAVRDHERFSSTHGVGYEVRPVPMMIALDPPDHTRLRRIVQRDFTPTAVERWRPLVEQLVDALLDDALERGTLDWARTIAYPLPVRVIADMLGVPPERGDDFKRWSDATLDALAAEVGPSERAHAEQQVFEFAMYLDELVQSSKGTLARPGTGAQGDDLVHLLLAPRSGEVLTDMELVSVAMLLLVAGHETTTNLIGNMAAALLDHPDQWARLKQQPDLVVNAVEEILRYDSPIQGFFRNTTTEIELHETTIPAGVKVMMLYGAANRDPEVFADADALRVDRDLYTHGLARHMAFGAGIHLCLGAHVARLEGQVLLRRMLERIDRLEPAGGGERTRNPLLRGMTHLPITVHAA